MLSCATVAIVIEDGTFTFDTRVQRQCKALKELGLRVIVVCPSAPGERAGIVEENGISVIKYAAYEANGLRFSQRILEHSIKLFVPFFILMFLRCKHDLRAVQFCNPTDFGALLGRLCSFTGVKYIFDQHDLVPEIYEFGRENPNRLVLRILLKFESWAYRWSHHVFVVNESFREIALNRGGIHASKITVVRNGPDDAVFDYPVSPVLICDKRDDLRRVGYLGNINAQDGLDLLIDIASEAKKNGMRFIFEVIGDGGGLYDIKSLVSQEDVVEYFHFHGRKRWGGEIEEILDRCDFCVQPDPYSKLNEKSSMTKSLEYLARGKTFVSFPLAETLATSSEWAYFAEDMTREAFMNTFLSLVESFSDSDVEVEARRRAVKEGFSWMVSEREYKVAYAEFLGIVCEDL